MLLFIQVITYMYEKQLKQYVMMFTEKLEEEKNWKNLLNQLPECIAVINMKKLDSVLHSNYQMRKLLGYQEAFEEEFNQKLPALLDTINNIYIYEQIIEE